MGRSKRKSKGRNHKQGGTLPDYYLKNRVTVGMLEDFCKKIKNKNTVVEIADKVGLFPEPVLSALFVTGGKDNHYVGLILKGKFSWNSQDDDEEADEDEDYEEGQPYGINWADDVEEDTNIQSAVKQAIAQGVNPPKNLCELKEPADCVKPRKGLSYLEVKNDSPPAESAA